MTYPEHEKLSRVKDESQLCGEFADWLTEEKGAHIPGNLQDLLAEFFGVDLDRIEEEKRQMLAEIRK